MLHHSVTYTEMHSEHDEKLLDCYASLLIQNNSIVYMFVKV